MHLLCILMLALVLEGEVALRTSVALMALIVLPWAVGQGMIMNLVDAVQVENYARFMVGAMTFSLPALLFMLLAMTGQIERHRVLLLSHALLALPLAVVAWGSQLVIQGVWLTPWGIWYQLGGPLYALNAAFLTTTIAIGIYVCRHIIWDQGIWLQGRRIGFVLLISVIALPDLLLVYGVGVYPFSVFPILVATSMFIWWQLSGQLGSSTPGHRGLDRGEIRHLAVFVATLPLLVASAWVASPRGHGGGLGMLLVLLLPLLGTLQAVGMLIRHYWPAAEVLGIEAEDAEHVLEFFATLTHEQRDDEAVANALIVTLSEHTGLEQVALYLPMDGDRWRGIGTDGEPISVAEEVRAWLFTQRGRATHRELVGALRGSLRIAAQALFDEVNASIVIPIVERDTLLAIIVARRKGGPRSMSATERHVLDEAIRLSARALTYSSLLREAEERAEIAKELEVATAARNARGIGESRTRYKHYQISAHYRPATHFGGDWWGAYQLSDGRLLIVIGDVVGHGVPAALVSSSVASACQTAQELLDDNFSLHEFLHVLNDVVWAVSSGEYSMSCFAAVFDAERSRVDFANAGYPFPWLCRRGHASALDEAAEQAGDSTASDSGEQEAVNIRAMVARGTRLGTSKPLFSEESMEVQAGDLVVFHCDVLVEAMNADGERYGERRLRHLLQGAVFEAGEDACKVLIDDVLAHVGGQSPGDDITVVAVRITDESDHA